MRKTVTIPAAGNILTVSMTGRSVIVEEMGVYPTAADVPTMELSPGISNYPLYPRSVYPNSEEFQQIVITGTAESAGDEITLLSTDQCLELSLNIVYSDQYQATPGDTSQETLSGATIFSWSAIAIQNADGKLPKKVYISSADNPIQYAFGVNPDQADPGNSHILPAPDANFENETLIEINGINFILAVRFAAEDSAVDSNLIYTFEY